VKLREMRAFQRLFIIMRFVVLGQSRIKIAGKNKKTVNPGEFVLPILTWFRKGQRYFSLDSAIVRRNQAGEGTKRTLLGKLRHHRIGCIWLHRRKSTANRCCRNGDTVALILRVKLSRITANESTFCLNRLLESNRPLFAALIKNKASHFKCHLPRSGRAPCLDHTRNLNQNR
jgi:hypothetical protein